MIIHEEPVVNLRTVQKDFEAAPVLQMGHWATDVGTNERFLVWEDVRHIPYHLYEEP